jgi:nucleotide-binding universal stress UspA family protein
MQYSSIIAKIRTANWSNVMKAIIAIDDSPISSEVLESVLRRRWPEHTQVKIITVLPPMQLPADDPDFADGLNKISEERNMRARHFCDRVRSRILQKDPTLMVHFDIREGAPAAEILNAAVEWTADKIYVGCHRKDFSSGNPLGSVSLNVALYAPCSVEIVRPKLRTRVPTMTAPFSV